MGSLSIVLVVAAVLVTLGVLFAGLFVMARGGETNRKWGNKLMRLRIAAQLVAILLFVLAMLLRGG